MPLSPLPTPGMVSARLIKPGRGQPIDTESCPNQNSNVNVLKVYGTPGEGSLSEFYAQDVLCLMQTLNWSARDKYLVDVTGFEPATPCLQSMEIGFRKPFRFSSQNKIQILKSRERMCLDVRRCGYLFAGSLQKSLHSSAIAEGAKREATSPSDTNRATRP